MEVKRFKVGDAVMIKKCHSGSGWYTDDIYYVIGYVPYSIHYDLLLVRTIGGLQLRAHQSKFDLAERELSRDEKISYLLD